MASVLDQAYENGVFRLILVLGPYPDVDCGSLVS